jgi:predicted transcriptional regulator
VPDLPRPQNSSKHAAYGRRSIGSDISGSNYKETNAAMDEAVLGLTAQLVSSYVTNNRVPGDRLSALIQTVYQTLSTARTSAVAAAAKVEPVVAVKKSVFPDRIVCLVCGQGYSMLKRHLGTEHQLTPVDYRARYGREPASVSLAPTDEPGPTCPCVGRSNSHDHHKHRD